MSKSAAELPKERKAKLCDRDGHISELESYFALVRSATDSS
ncbi:MAG: hypothetical protein P1U67_13010 [Alcanivoracaceae bacterium]|nr:hypothetical protein [Alcanivoracaceae bacterium]